MKFSIKILLIVLFTSAVVYVSAKQNKAFRPKVVYKSNDLVITQLSKNTYEHTSFLETESFGNVPCNGLIVTSNKEAIVFDTPTSDESSTELINWIGKVLNYKINAIIPTHFHKDNLGGLHAFDEHNIPSYAYFKTIALAKTHNLAVPRNGFQDSLVLKVGNESVTVKFFGEGHTIDNVVGYFPSEQVLFGGCLIKELDADKGYLGDANVAEWSNTVERIKKEYPHVRLIIPGHGKYGDKELLDYTIRLFKKK